MQAERSPGICNRDCFEFAISKNSDSEIYQKGVVSAISITENLQASKDFDIIDFRNGVDCMDEKEYMRLVGILKDRRKAMKYTQDELAQKLNVNKKQVYRYEKGEQPPDLNMLIKWANVLDLKIEFTIK